MQYKRDKFSVNGKTKVRKVQGKVLGTGAEKNECMSTEVGSSVLYHFSTSALQHLSL